MNIRELFDSIPPEDTFLNIWIENIEPNEIFPEYKPHDEYYICIYGVTEEELDNALISIRAKGHRYANVLCGLSSNGIIWDVVIKEIFLFETKEGALFFKDFANYLSENDFCDFTDNVLPSCFDPWIHVPMITDDSLFEIIDFYGRIYGVDCI